MLKRGASPPFQHRLSRDVASNYSMAKVPKSEDDFFAGEPGLLAVFDYDYEAVFEGNLMKT